MKQHSLLIIMKNWPLKNKDSVSVSDRIEIAFEKAWITYFHCISNKSVYALSYLFIINRINFEWWRLHRHSKINWMNFIKKPKMR